jgi:group I intron endonuclease
MHESVMGYIYSLTNKVNGKKYIGQSQQADIKKRWGAYKAMKKNSIGTVLLRALKKNGIDNFKFQIICICFDEDCNQYEKDYIKKYNTMTPSGYNMQDGGKNPSITCRKKIVLSDEQKEKMKGRFKGEKSPNFGKPMSEEQRKKISESRKKFEANKDTLYKKRKRSEQKRRTVHKYDENHNLIGTFASLSEAAKTINTSYQTILTYANQAILYRGYYWTTEETQHVKGLIPFGLTLGHEALKKRVNQYDLQNNFIRTFDSISSAARSVEGYNIPIAKCAKNPDATKSYKGFIWKFEAPELTEEPKRKKTKSSREYKSFLRNPDGSIATLC